MRRNEHRREYEVFLALLRETRLAAGITQQDVAKHLGNTQTFVSKCERGERRIDVIDLLEYLAAVNQPPSIFVNRLIADLRTHRTSAKTASVRSRR